MPAKEILLLGNPILRQKCAAVKNFGSAELSSLVADLKDTLEDFRKKRGFGRGIAAPQIGFTKQVVYIDFEYKGALINPKITRRSAKKFKLWDDCFSFPDILVQVIRNYSIIVSFKDESGKASTLKAEGALSELLQHEIDHVNGILAIDRAVHSRHITLRSEYNKLMSRSSTML